MVCHASRRKASTRLLCWENLPASAAALSYPRICRRAPALCAVWKGVTHMDTMVVGLFVIPWLATLSGSLLALRLRLRSARAQSGFLGFAAGVMIASSVWSLLLPAFSESGSSVRGVGIVSLGFALGCLGMLLLDKIMPHQHLDQSAPEGPRSHMSRPMLLVMARGAS